MRRDQWQRRPHDAAAHRWQAELLDLERPAVVIIDQDVVITQLRLRWDFPLRRGNSIRIERRVPGVFLATARMPDRDLVRSGRTWLNDETARYVPAEKVLHGNGLAGAEQCPVEQAVIDIGRVETSHRKTKLVWTD